MAKDYSKMNREELLKEISDIEDRKSYGLVWEETPEDVVEKCQSMIPVLIEDKSRKIETNERFENNFIIEGDNYHALSSLNYTHSKSVDIIYIDPPYNTGAKDWKYNNNYVDENDTFRHSKWLSMMNHRLKISKKLLTDEGSLICAIDHNEQEALGVMLEEVFPEREKVCVTIIHNPGEFKEVIFLTPMSMLILFFLKTEPVFLKLKEVMLSRHPLEIGAVKSLNAVLQKTVSILSVWIKI
jgi:adenine-specific DNA-methyltransferase